MIESLQEWASKSETWFNILLSTILLWAVKQGFILIRLRALSTVKMASENHRKKVEEFAGDDALTYKAIASREAWLVIFLLGSIFWFAYISLSPLRPLLNMGTSIFLLTMSPVWILQILFVSRNIFTEDVFRERSRLRSELSD